MITEGYKQLGMQRQAVETQGNNKGTRSLKTEKLGWTYLECSHATGISISWLQKLVHWKKIPHVKVGRRVFFIPEDIAPWFKSHRRNHVS